MTLARAVVLALLLAFAPVTTVRAQADPLQEANQLFRQGQLDRAMERVNNFLSSHPKDARGRFLKGLIFTEQNKPDDAIKVFAELSQDYPELPEPYNNLAVLYASQGAYDKARNALESAIRTHPSYATAHENLGDIYAKMASQAYDKALQLDRSNQAAQTKLNLIKELFSQGTRAPEKVSAATSDAAPAPAKSVPPQSSTPATPASAPAAAASAPAAAAPATPAPQTAVATAAATVPATPTPAAPSSTPATTGAKASTAATPQPAPAAPAKPSAAATSPEAAVPSSKPVPADQKAEVPSAPASDEVMGSVNAWAKAWSSNDVRGYLASYAPDFQTPHKMSRSAWEAERKSRVAKPRKIDVEVASAKITFDGKNHAIVSFKQHYRSGAINVSSSKTLVMVKNGDKWLIQQERAGS
jgi:tetratricopeptide (TPR) repeat protein